MAHRKTRSWSEASLRCGGGRSARDRSGGRQLLLDSGPEHTGPRDLNSFTSPSGAFAIYDRASGGLWSHFRFQELAFAGILEAPPDRLVFAQDGGAFAYGTNQIHVVTPGQSYQWPRPPGTSLDAVTSEFALFKVPGKLHIHDLKSGAQRHSIDGAALHSIPPPSAETFAAAVSANSRFLLIDCAHGALNRSSVTDLRTMKSRHLRKRRAWSEHGADLADALFVSDSGASVLRYGNAVDYVAAGRKGRKALVDPELNPRKLSSVLAWLYRAAIVSVVLMVAASLHARAREAGGRRGEVGYAQILAYKAVAILLIPGFVLFVVFASAVTKETSAHQGGVMSGGLAWIVFGGFLLFVLVAFAKLTARVADLGMRLALSMKARPKDAAVVVPLCLAMAFLGVPALAEFFQTRIGGG